MVQFVPHLITRSQAKRCLGVVADLERGEIGGKKLEKLRGLPVWSIRLNRADRLLLAKRNGHWVIVELVENHRYDKAKCLKPTVFRSIFGADNSIDSLDDLNDSFDEDTDCRFEVSSKENLNAVYFFGQTPIVFTDDQRRTVNIARPAVLSGPPGSGKTCVAHLLILRFCQQNPTAEKPVLYVAPSQKLVDQMATLWQQKLLDTNVVVHSKTYEQLIGIDAEFSSSQKDMFVQWLAKVKKTPQIGSQALSTMQASPMKLFLDFSLIDAVGEHLYLDPKVIGTRQAYFPPEIHQDVTKLHQLYQNYRNENPQPDSPPVSTQPYSLIVADEAQNLLLHQLQDLFEKSGPQRSFVACLDTEQCLLTASHVERFLLQMFFRAGVKNPEPYILVNTWRCTQPVVNWANQVLRWKHEREDKKTRHRYRAIKSELTSSGQCHIIQRTGEKDLAKLKDVVTQFGTVVIADMQYTAEIEQKLGTKMILTAEQALGFDFNTVILYQPMMGDIAKRVAKLKQGEATLSDIEWLNALFIAITRARYQVIIIQDEVHGIEGLLNDLKAHLDVEKKAPVTIEECFTREDYQHRFDSLVANNLWVQAEDVLVRHLGFQPQQAQAKILALKTPPEVKIVQGTPVVSSKKFPKVMFGVNSNENRLIRLIKQLKAHRSNPAFAEKVLTHLSEQNAAAHFTLRWAERDDFEPAILDDLWQLANEMQQTKWVEQLLKSNNRQFKFMVALKLMFSNNAIPANEFQTLLSSLFEDVNENDMQLPAVFIAFQQLIFQVPNVIFAPVILDSKPSILLSLIAKKPALYKILSFISPENTRGLDIALLFGDDFEATPFWRLLVNTAGPCYLAILFEKFAINGETFAEAIRQNNALYLKYRESHIENQVATLQFLSKHGIADAYHPRSISPNKVLRWLNEIDYRHDMLSGEAGALETVKARLADGYPSGIEPCLSKTLGPGFGLARDLLLSTLTYMHHALRLAVDEQSMTEQMAAYLLALRVASFLELVPPPSSDMDEPLNCHNIAIFSTHDKGRENWFVVVNFDEHGFSTDTPEITFPKAYTEASLLIDVSKKQVYQYTDGVTSLNHKPSFCVQLWPNFSQVKKALICARASDHSADYRQLKHLYYTMSAYLYHLLMGSTLFPKLDRRCPVLVDGEWLHKGFIGENKLTLSMSEPLKWVHLSQCLTTLSKENWTKLLLHGDVTLFERQMGEPHSSKLLFFAVIYFPEFKQWLRSKLFHQSMCYEGQRISVFQWMLTTPLAWQLLAALFDEAVFTVDEAQKLKQELLNPIQADGQPVYYPFAALVSELHIYKTASTKSHVLDDLGLALWGLLSNSEKLRILGNNHFVKQKWCANSAMYEFRGEEGMAQFLQEHLALITDFRSFYTAPENTLESVRNAPYLYYVLLFRRKLLNAITSMPEEWIIRFLQPLVDNPELMTQLIINDQGVKTTLLHAFSESNCGAVLLYQYLIQCVTKLSDVFNKNSLLREQSHSYYSKSFLRKSVVGLLLLNPRGLWVLHVLEKKNSEVSLVLKDYIFEHRDTIVSALVAEGVFNYPVEQLIKRLSQGEQQLSPTQVNAVHYALKFVSRFQSQEGSFNPLALSSLGDTIEQKVDDALNLAARSVSDIRARVQFERAGFKTLIEELFHITHAVRVGPQSFDGRRQAMLLALYLKCQYPLSTKDQFGGDNIEVISMTVGDTEQFSVVINRYQTASVKYWPGYVDCQNILWLDVSRQVVYDQVSLHSSGFNQYIQTAELCWCDWPVADVIARNFGIAGELVLARQKFTELLRQMIGIHWMQTPDLSLPIERLSKQDRQAIDSLQLSKSILQKVFHSMSDAECRKFLFERGRSTNKTRMQQWMEAQKTQAALFAFIEKDLYASLILVEWLFSINHSGDMPVLFEVSANQNGSLLVQRLITQQYDNPYFHQVLKHFITEYQKTFPTETLQFWVYHLSSLQAEYGLWQQEEMIDLMMPLHQEELSLFQPIDTTLTIGQGSAIWDTLQQNKVDLSLLGLMPTVMDDIIELAEACDNLNNLSASPLYQLHQSKGGKSLMVHLCYHAPSKMRVLLWRMGVFDDKLIQAVNHHLPLFVAWTEIKQTRGGKRRKLTIEQTSSWAEKIQVDKSLPNELDGLQGAMDIYRLGTAAEVPATGALKTLYDGGCHYWAGSMACIFVTLTSSINSHEPMSQAKKACLFAFRIKAFLGLFDTHASVTVVKCTEKNGEVHFYVVTNPVRMGRSGWLSYYKHPHCQVISVETGGIWSGKDFIHLHGSKHGRICMRVDESWVAWPMLDELLLYHTSKNIRDELPLLKTVKRKVEQLLTIMDQRKIPKIEPTIRVSSQGMMATKSAPTEAASSSLKIGPK